LPAPKASTDEGTESIRGRDHTRPIGTILVDAERHEWTDDEQFQTYPGKSGCDFGTQWIQLNKATIVPRDTLPSSPRDCPRAPTGRDADATIADTILDPPLHHARRLTLQGESLRLATKEPSPRSDKRPNLTDRVIINTEHFTAPDRSR
jgi:hypothetical protein